MNEILKVLYDAMDRKGIPNLSVEQWNDLNAKYDKETIIKAIIEHIRIHKPDPPINNISLNDMIDCFYKLREADPIRFFLRHDQVKEVVMEKFDDYKRPYKDFGLGVVQMGNSFIDVSNYFNQTLRMECDVYGFKSAHHRWRTGEDLRTVLLALWRLGNDRLNEHSFVVAFRLASYIATQFKPHVAKFVYDMSKAKTVFDSSCGWGDRLAGFYCSNALEYYGCDPNPETYRMYMDQCIDYEMLLGNRPKILEHSDHFVLEGIKKVVIYRKAAEDFDYSILPPIDCAFTSPPYFSTELYNAGGEHEDEQSWKRYDTYEKWRDNFYLPVNERTYECLSDNGLQIVNIQDPKVRNRRYHASDDLIDCLTTKYNDCHFIGQMGMRIMQRPRNIKKDLLKTHFKQTYIEPMWVFGKNRNYFMNTSEGLIDFMT